MTQESYGKLPLWKTTGGIEIRKLEDVGDHKPPWAPLDNAFEVLFVLNADWTTAAHNADTASLGARLAA